MAAVGESGIFGEWVLWPWVKTSKISCCIQDVPGALLNNWKIILIKRLIKIKDLKESLKD